MKRLEYLDGLRGVLAVYVMLGHLAPFAILPGWLQTGVSHGGAAVDVFFILSGLVITQSLARAGGQTVPFLLARAARIFPVFLPVFALAVLIAPLSCGFEDMPWIGRDSAARTICVAEWPRNWAADIATHLTMTHGLFPDGAMPNTWVRFLGAAWSLSAEWQFYILVLLVSRTGPTRLGHALLALALAGLVWRHCMPEYWQFSRAFLPNQAHFFALGVASLAVVQQRRGGLLGYAATLAVTLVICARQDSLGKLLPPLIWTLCLAVQMRPRMPGLRWIGAALGCRATQFLGVISYCVYLVNEPVHKLLAWGLSRLADGDGAVFTALWLPGAVLLPVLASVWLHAYVEVPGLRWGRGLRAARAPYPTASSSRSRKQPSP
jgi:peptidoglycan/LPS O-acetylase OafA/YrhL